MKDTRKLSELRNWDKNPRKIDAKSFDLLKRKIKRWGQFKPVLITKDGEVIGGNMRLKAYKEMGIEDVWVSIVEPKTEAEKVEIAITDNESSGTWDIEKLELLAVEYKDDIDLDDYKIDLHGKLWGDFLPENELDDSFSQKLGEVVYEPKETNHSISDLYTTNTDFEKDIEALDNEDLKDLLRCRAYFFTSFNFSKIADYYAYQATKEEQKVIEKLGLVLLDKNQLVENGFSDLLEDL